MKIARDSIIISHFATHNKLHKILLIFPPKDCCDKIISIQSKNLLRLFSYTTIKNYICIGKLEIFLHSKNKITIAVCQQKIK